MATETSREVGTVAETLDWRAGAVAGGVGALVMAALIVAMNAPVLAVAIPSLYALAPPPSLPVGIVVHVFHGAVLGVAFAWIADTLSVDGTRDLLGLGVAWGVVAWVVLAALVMPVWLGAVGSPATPTFPNFALPSLLWHVVYGLVLGGAFVWIGSRR